MANRVPQANVAVFAVPTGANVRVPQANVAVFVHFVSPAHRLSGYLKDQLINHLFRSASFAKPTGLSIALYTDVPTDSDPGVEVSGGSYARVAFPPLDSNWAAPSAGNGVTSNLVAITFPAPSAPWGIVIAYGIVDAAVGGNLLAWSTFSAAVAPDIGTNPRFVIGALTVTFG
jgi:hypothetical protein